MAVPLVVSGSLHHGILDRALRRLCTKLEGASQVWQRGAFWATEPHMEHENTSLGLQSDLLRRWDWGGFRGSSHTF